MMFNANLLAFDANYSNLENYAFDAKYSDIEYFDRGLPINKIAPMICIYKIFTDNFCSVLGFDVYPVPRPRPCPCFGLQRVPRPTPMTLSLAIP